MPQRTATVDGVHWAHLKVGASRALKECPPAVGAVLQSLATTKAATFSGRLGELLKELRTEGDSEVTAPQWLKVARTFCPVTFWQRLAESYRSSIGVLIKTRRLGQLVKCADCGTRWEAGADEAVVEVHDFPDIASSKPLQCVRCGKAATTQHAASRFPAVLVLSVDRFSNGKKQKAPKTTPFIMTLLEVPDGEAAEPIRYRLICVANAT